MDAKSIKYEMEGGYINEPQRKRETDIGIDLPSSNNATIMPGETVIVGTGVYFEFPTLGKIRRFITKLLLGMEIVGVGTLLWPRGSSKHAVLSGVIDVGYRGEVKVRVYNPTKYPIIFDPGEMIAQMVPVLALNIPLTNVQYVDKNTDRGEAGGIHHVR